MFVIFKNQHGTYSVRPAYIGFIKNNVIRRSLGCLVFPLTLMFTILINLLQAALVSIYLIWQSFYVPLSKLTSIRDTEFWKRPRTKDDKNDDMG